MQTFKILALLAMFGFITAAKKSTVTDTEKTQWISLQEATNKLSSEKRPVLIDLYTDWCGWCKVMDKKTYSNKKVSEYLAKKFYAVKLNAETRQQVSWAGKEYSYNDQAKMNDFAMYLTNGQLMFPTTIIIPEDGQPQAIPGYLDPKNFEVIAKYFGEGNYGKVPFAEFEKKFKSSW